MVLDMEDLGSPALICLVYFICQAYDKKESVDKKFVIQAKCLRTDHAEAHEMKLLWKPWKSNVKQNYSQNPGGFCLLLGHCHPIIL